MQLLVQWRINPRKTEFNHPSNILNVKQTNHYESFTRRGCSLIDRKMSQQNLIC